MKRAHPQPRRQFLTDKLCYALAHLACSFVGERQCEYAARIVAVGYQIGYLVGEHTRLARTCAGNNQRGPAVVAHRSKLLFVQTL